MNADERDAGGRPAGQCQVLDPAELVAVTGGAQEAVRGRHADRCATGDPRAGAVAVVEPVPLQHRCLEPGRPAALGPAVVDELGGHGHRGESGEAAEVVLRRRRKRPNRL